MLLLASQMSAVPHDTVCLLQMMGATATMLYGITLLLDPVPAEQYAAEELKQSKKWGRNPFGRKKKGKEMDAPSTKEVCTRSALRPREPG